jgi:hypothetical protein
MYYEKIIGGSVKNDREFHPKWRRELNIGMWCSW